MFCYLHTLLLILWFNWFSWASIFMDLNKFKKNYEQWSYKCNLTLMNIWFHGLTQHWNPAKIGVYWTIIIPQSASPLFLCVTVSIFNTLISNLFLRWVPRRNWMDQCTWRKGMGWTSRPCITVHGPLPPTKKVCDSGCCDCECVCIIKPVFCFLSQT